ncbi:hypothetical protein pb186bvf_005190 [Paramecium bursaria]
MIELKQLLLFRGFILMSLCPQSDFKKFRLIIEDSKQMAEKLNDIKCLLTRQYLINLFIACTRAWEGYDEENQELIFESDPLEDIQTSYKIIKAAITNPPSIRIIEDQSLINIEFIKLFYQTFVKWTLQMNCLMIHQTARFGLEVLSSFDGQNTYVLSNLDNESFIKTLMHKFTHNLYRFVNKNKEFNFLSPKKNRDLRIYNRFIGKYEQCEAGQYFDRNAEIQADFAFISPFTLLMGNDIHLQQ